MGNRQTDSFCFNSFYYYTDIDDEGDDIDDYDYDYEDNNDHLL